MIALRRMTCSLLMAGISVSTSLPALANSDNGTHYILSINIHDSGNIIVMLDGHSNTEGCASVGSENSILISNKNGNFKLMYAMAMTAQAEGRPIEGWVSGCTDVWGTGTLKIPTVTTLYVHS